MISLFIAPVGVGKTTHAVRTAHKFWKLHPDSPVYTNIPDLAGAYFIDISETDTFRVWHKGTDWALYLLDEAGVGTTNNRNFKNFKQDCIMWIAEHRHEKIDMYVYSQAVDMDINFVRKCEAIYTMNKLGPWTYCRRWFKAKKGETDIETGLPRFPWHPSPIPFVLGEIVYRKHWYKYFNSYWSPFEHLPDVPESRKIGSLNKEESSTGTPAQS